MLAGWLWRDDRFTSLFGQSVTELCGVIGPVGQEPFGGRDALEKHGRTDQISRISNAEITLDLVASEDANALQVEIFLSGEKAAA